MEPTPKELQAKVNQLKKDKSRGKRKAEVGSGRSPTTSTPLDTGSSSLQGVQSSSEKAFERGLASPSPSEVERALDTASRILAFNHNWQCDSCVP